jgi:hypothetical protein
MEASEPHKCELCGDRATNKHVFNTGEYHFYCEDHGRHKQGDTVFHRSRHPEMFYM